MTWEIILQIILFGIALSMDAFSVSITQGLTMKNLNNKRHFFIAFIYGFFQGLFPLIGFFLIELVNKILGDTVGVKAGEIMSTTVSWISFVALLFIGGKMLIESIKNIKNPSNENEESNFSVKTVILMGVAVSIDALATGVAFHNTNSEGVSLSTPNTIWLHVFIIMIITFLFSLLGVKAGNKIEKLFKNKKEITGVIGGVILILLAIWVILSHYCL